MSDTPICRNTRFSAAGQAYECRLPRHREGPCDFMLREPDTCEHSGAPLAGRDHATYLHDVSDDQLRAECSRRCMTAMSLSQWSDELLRAECGRRGIDAMTPEMTRAWANDRKQYITERDEWKTVAESTSVNLRNANGERDEWRRRAEEVAARHGPRGGAEELWSEACSNVSAALRRECEREAAECGPGIAAMPARDESHWFDPIDLLCEDA